MSERMLGIVSPLLLPEKPLTAIITAFTGKLMTLPSSHPSFGPGRCVISLQHTAIQSLHLVPYDAILSHEGMDGRLLSTQKVQTPNPYRGLSCSRSLCKFLLHVLGVAVIVQPLLHRTAFSTPLDSP